MRYSFHGKVRATGQQVDGYVEASNSTEAIDRLADRGIIGVYTVRPEPKPPKNAVLLDGETPEEDPKPAPRLEAPPQQLPTLPAPAPVQVPVTALADPAVSALMEKIGGLMSQVEKLLARPPQQQVIYQNALPARENSARTLKPRSLNESNSSTLRDIFQTNLDLRQSLEKLASNAGSNVAKKQETAPFEPNGTHEAGNGAHDANNGTREPMKPREMLKAEVVKSETIKTQPVKAQPVS